MSDNNKNLPILNRVKDDHGDVIPQRYCWGPYLVRPHSWRKTWVLEDNGVGDEFRKEFRLLRHLREYIAKKHL